MSNVRARQCDLQWGWRWAGCARWSTNGKWFGCIERQEHWMELDACCCSQGRRSKVNITGIQGGIVTGKNIVDEPSDYVKLYLDNTFWMYCWRPPMKSWNAEGKLDRIQILYYLHWGLCSCWDKSSIGIDDYDWISVWKEGIIAAIVVKGTRTTKA